MFQRSLKKQQKLHALLAMLGDVSGLRCLLVTCGDNNGALNWHFRNRGGRWIWSDVEAGSTAEMSDFLGEPVIPTAEHSLAFADNTFDRVVAIDVLEHLEDDQPFLHEIRRILGRNGQAIVTVPNGDPGLTANQIKWQLGMTPSVYGHKRAGYTVPELSASISRAGLEPVDHGGYSRFFTEIVELTINFGYVKVLSRKADASSGHIAPQTSGEMKEHGLAYRLYERLYPVLQAVSSLDRFLPPHHYAVIVTSRKLTENRS